jgi:hypothetical protein
MNNSTRENHSEWKNDKSIFKNAPIYFALDAGFVRTNVKKYRNFNNEINNGEMAQNHNDYKIPGMYPKVRFSKNNFSQNGSVPTGTTHIAGQAQAHSFNKNEKIQGVINPHDKNFSSNKISRDYNSQVLPEKNEEDLFKNSPEINYLTQSKSNRKFNHNSSLINNVHESNLSMNKNNIIENNNYNNNFSHNKNFIAEIDKKTFPSPKEYNKIYPQNNYTNMNINMNNYYHQQQWAIRNMSMNNPNNNFPMIRNQPNPQIVGNVIHNSNMSNLPSNMYFYDQNFGNNTNNIINNLPNNNLVNNNILKNHQTNDVISLNHNSKSKSTGINRIKISNSMKNLTKENLNNLINIEKKDSQSSFLNVNIKLQDEIKSIQVNRGEDFFKKASEFCYLNKLNPNLVKPIFNLILLAIDSMDKVMLHEVTKEEHKLIEKIRFDFEEYRAQLNEERLNLSCITIFQDETKDNGTQNSNEGLELSASTEKLNFSF